MRKFVFWELIIIILVFAIRFVLRKIKQHRDRKKAIKVIDYIGRRTDNANVKELQKILGVEDKDEDKDKN